MLNLQLLTEEDIIGEECLSIFKKISPLSIPTDIATLKMADPTKKYCEYWLDSYNRYFTEGRSWQIGCDCHIQAKYVNNKSNLITNSKLNNKNIGIRLKVDYEDIKNHILKDKNDKMYKYMENGINVVLALEYPQTFISDENPDKEELELLYQKNELKKSKKKFTLWLDEKPYNMYYYKDNKYIKIEEKWAIIKPIEWYYDEVANVLISKKVIISGIPFAEFSGRYIKYFDFEQSLISPFINKKIPKESIISSMDKELYLKTLGSSLEYENRVNELNYWNNYKIARKKRKHDLNELKNLITTVKTIDELENKIDICEIIDETLKLNEEDEKIIKEKCIKLQKH